MKGHGNFPQGALYEENVNLYWNFAMGTASNFEARFSFLVTDEQTAND